MKGYVNVHIDQIQEAISGFENKRALGKQFRDKGIELYYHKHYILGGWYVKWRYKHSSKIEFCRAKLGSFSSWDELLWSVLTKEETDVLSWWTWNNSDYKINPLKALASQCATGYVLVDDEMAAAIENYRGFK